MKGKALTIVLGLINIVSGHNWQENLRPKLYCAMTDRDFTSFRGNLTAKDHFTGLFYTEFTPDSGDRMTISRGSTQSPGGGEPGILLIGARNIVYKLNPSELRLTQTLLWPAEDSAKDTCLVKGKSTAMCQNFIVVIQQYDHDPSRFLMCGTNAFSPVCKEFVDERGSFVERSQMDGLGLAPFDPGHNSTAVLVGNDLYAGTVADFTGVDSIIFRKPLRTPQYDSTQLNDPDFVGSFEHGDHVYFFFREAAVEYINCGKAVFSRVARVCKNDKGGPYKSKHSWTSFLKTRLNCSVPGNYPFYFDEIQGVTPLIKGHYGGSKKDTEDFIVYATFSTPINSIGGSAVCAFKLRDISDSFAGRFKEQRSMSANWLPVDEHKVPSPRPGTCINDTKSLPDVNMNFIKTHSLMDEPVLPFFGAPIVIRTGLISRFTVLVVDPQVRTTDGKTYDIVFVGTTNGRVIKSINAKSADSRQTVDSVVIEELQVFSSNTIIKDLKVIGGGKAGLKSLGQIVAMSVDEVRSFPVQRCDRASNCQECVALQDPYCAWEIRSSRCTSGDWNTNMASSFLQSVSNGRNKKCPGGADVLAPVNEVYSYERQFSRLKLGQIVNIIDESQFEGDAGNGDDNGNRDGKSNLIPGGASSGSGVESIDPSEQLFSLEMLLITVSAGAVAALVVGFVTGYCCGRKCRKDDDLLHLPYPDTEYEYFEQRGGLARPGGFSRPGGLMSTIGPGAPLLPAQASKIGDGRQEEVTYAEPDIMPNLGPRPPPPSIGSLLQHRGGGGSGPALTGLGSMKGPTPFPRGSSGSRLPGETSHYSSSLLNPANKFNTIHTGGQKQRGMQNLNQYEAAAEALLGGKNTNKEPSGYYGRGRDNYHAYHMSTLGRLRGKDPLAHTDSDPLSNSARNNATAGIRILGSSSSSNDSNSSGKGQVVDSAYGTTTRSAKKVYL